MVNEHTLPPSGTEYEGGFKDGENNGLGTLTYGKGKSEGGQVCWGMEEWENVERNILRQIRKNRMEGCGWKRYKTITPSKTLTPQV